MRPTAFMFLPPMSAVDMRAWLGLEVGLGVGVGVGLGLGLGLGLAVEIRTSTKARLARSPVEPPVFERLRRSWLGVGVPGFGLELELGLGLG